MAASAFRSRSVASRRQPVASHLFGHGLAYPIRPRSHHCGPVPPAGFRLLVAGGLFYTVGVTFYVLANVWPWCHGIWHLFVLAGSVSHYFAILFYL
jgi:channel protein (hemolysin III family)